MGIKLSEQAGSFLAKMIGLCQGAIGQQTPLWGLFQAVISADRMVVRIIPLMNGKFACFWLNKMVSLFLKL